MLSKLRNMFSSQAPQPQIAGQRYYLLPAAGQAIEMTAATYANCYTSLDRRLAVRVELVAEFQRNVVPDMTGQYYENIYLRFTGNDRQIFENLTARWQNNSLVLYRAIAGYHRCWPRLQAGNAVSEGQQDAPTFTMGQAATRWLPCYYQDNLQDIAAGRLGFQDMLTAIAAYTQAVPIGVVLSFRVGRTVGQPVAFMNSGEQLVRGPVAFPGFAFHKIVFFGNGANGRIFSRFCLGFGPQDLMPARPFQPNRVTTAEWFGRLTTWYRNYTLGPRAISRGRGPISALEAPASTAANNAPQQGRQRRGSF